MARKIGILGGTFDPIHCGHLDVGDAAHAAIGFDRMFVMTSNMPPHRPQPDASPYHRFAMTALAVASRPAWRTLDLELRSGALSYTTDTLRQFHERGYASLELFFVIGADAFADIASWRDYPAILDLAHFAVVSRPGHLVEALPSKLPALASRMVAVGDGRGTEVAPSPLIFLIPAPTADVSSTAIRERRAAGKSIAGMVPPLVQQHIEQHGLYTAMTPGRRAADQGITQAAGRLHGKE